MYGEVINMLDDWGTVATMIDRKISWEGHVWWEQEHIIKQASKWIVESKRRLGCPRQRWVVFKKTLL